MTGFSRFLERFKFTRVVKNFGGRNLMIFDPVEGTLYAIYGDITLAIHKVSPRYYPERKLPQKLKRMGYTVDEEGVILPPNWEHSIHGWIIQKI